VDSRWTALIVLTAARASMGFQFQSLASVSPLLVREFDIGYADVGFLIGLYMLPGIALALPGGALGHRFGDKRVVAVGLILMAIGGVVSGLAQTYPMLATGRLLSGVGATLLNVLMSKMITDWFAGREIRLAMAVFANSFPIGVGLALLSLGAAAEAFRWPVAFHATAAAAFASLLLLAFVYRPHLNDGKASAAGSSRISRHEIALVSLAGAIWGIYNGAFGIMFGFAPNLLVQAGLTVGAAGSLLSLAAWLIVASVQIGGIVSQRWGHPIALMLAGVGGWGLGLLMLPTVDPMPVVIMIGLLQGLPVGVIMALPSEVLRPESRAIGMGLFYTWLYIGHAGLPPAAGWIQDLTGKAAAPIYFAGALVLSIVLWYALARRLQTRALQPAPLSA
jgi:MFS family permease